MIDLDRKHRETVTRILAAHVPDIEVRAFGSRVGGKARTYADLDLALVGEKGVEASRLEALRDAFSDSDLPMQVDVLDWHAISPRFRTVIEKTCEVIQTGGRARGRSPTKGRPC